jgi:hypothetical protein
LSFDSQKSVVFTGLIVAPRIYPPSAVGLIVGLALASALAKDISPTLYPLAITFRHSIEPSVFSFSKITAYGF